MRRKVEIDTRRTPIDTLETAIYDLQRQEEELTGMLKVNKKLQFGLQEAREKAIKVFTDGGIKLLPAKGHTDEGTRNVGFLGAGLAARAAETITAKGSPLHLETILAVLRNQPGLQGLQKESLRATMNSDSKRKIPRLCFLGNSMYGIAGLHDNSVSKTRRRKQKQLPEAQAA
jgi:hypothetical protein